MIPDRNVKISQKGTIRFPFGIFTIEKDVDKAVEAISRAVSK
jgi:cysteine sulfinate desulfinase/cysteine desulfurase-like protein